MTISLHAFDAQATPFDIQCAALEDPRPHPTEAALVQLGRAMMTELTDLIEGTALEDVQTILAESLIGAFHSAAGRLDRKADQARDRLRRLERDFDGSEACDTDLQQALRETGAADAATLACELIRDAASECWTTASGEVWNPWKGSRRATRLSAAQIDVRQALRAVSEARSGASLPSGPIVAFRGAPSADSPEDAGRIFDALNWAREQWPDMVLATTGARGAEKLAIKWAGQKRVSLIMARADFSRCGRAAPFRANDDLLALEPVCCLTLSSSIADQRGAPFGPALNLAQKARERGLRHLAVRARR